MSDQPLRILQVSTVEKSGGAARIARNLHNAYLKQGLQSWIAVGEKETHDPSVLQIPNIEARGTWSRSLFRLSNNIFRAYGHIRGVWLLTQILTGIADPKRLWGLYQGKEYFHYPGSWKILELPPERPNIVHCHNLHGDYFDLSLLQWLSRQIPVVLTLHDAWLLSGHCAHSFDCERWRTGCGKCPDLTIYPAARRDATKYNWSRKQRIFLKSRFYLATPSQWLMKKVEQSILAPAVVEARVIPNGVDLFVFRPASRQLVRAALGIPQEAKVLLYTAHSIRRNIWKDFQTLRGAVALVSEHMQEYNLQFLALGEDAPSERIGRAEIHFLPYQEDTSVVARYYQAADLYIHATRADTFPNTVLESLACGTPVVATAVGGIPEQIKNGVTGFLTTPRDANMMALRIEQLLSDIELRRRMGLQAAEVAREKFNLDRQVDEYLEWFNDIVSKRQSMIQEKK